MIKIFINLQPRMDVPDKPAFSTMLSRPSDYNYRPLITRLETASEKINGFCIFHFTINFTRDCKRAH